MLFMFPGWAGTFRFMVRVFFTMKGMKNGPNGCVGRREKSWWKGDDAV